MRRLKQYKVIRPSPFREIVDHLINFSFSFAVKYFFLPYEKCISLHVASSCHLHSDTLSGLFEVDPLVHHPSSLLCSIYGGSGIGN